MIKVLVVDDSALVRRMLTVELSRAGDIEIVGVAGDPFAARDQILKLKPHVVTLDIEMPRMDGLTFLRKLMHHCPLPVIIVSSLSEQGSQAAIAALECGAIDVIGKPGLNLTVPEFSRTLAEKIRAAANTRRATPPPTAPARGPAAPLRAARDHKILAVGASTGGTRAIAELLQNLPAHCPPTVIVQHMPAQFTAAFANRLDQLCPMTVREAVDGEPLRPGLALIAPGDRHLLIARNGLRYIARLKDGPRVFHQRPSVEVLFNSVARHAGPHAVGVILTGMGGDGGQGLLAMRNAGAITFAQDEQSCAVFGMPRVAIECGGACHVLPLDRIAPAIIEHLARPLAHT